MIMSRYFLRVGMLLCLSVLPCFAARAQNSADFVLYGKQNEKPLAMLMLAQPPHTRLRIGLDTLPPVSRLLPLLPRGTRYKGNEILLPDGSDYKLVPAKTLARQMAYYGSRSETRQQLIARLRQLTGAASASIVKARCPNAATFVAIGTLEQGIREIPYLPTGARVRVVNPVTKTEWEFFPIGGPPDLLPAPHNKDDGLRWTQQANGRWEEVISATHSRLRWTQRSDGFWEEAPLHAEGHSKRKLKS